MTEPFSPHGPQHILSDLCSGRRPSQRADGGGHCGRLSSPDEVAEAAYREGQEASGPPAIKRKKRGQRPKRWRLA